MLRRRDLITLLGAAATAPAVSWPLAAGAQQRQAMPVIGYLSSRTSESDLPMLAALRRGLNETGYTEGRNLTIEYRFADGQYDRLPALVTELIGRHVAVIVFGGARGGAVGAAWRLLRASNIPVVFSTGIDPVRSGLVASINRPGGTITGVYSLVGNLTAKNMGLMYELVPKAKTVAMLADTTGLDADSVRDAGEAAAKLGLQLIILSANTDGEIEAAFASLIRQRVDAMIVPTNPFFVTRAKQITALVARNRVPAIYARREFAEAGGLISYGYDVAEGYGHMGNYAARILNGDKPADLPVVLPSRFQLVINLKTAKALGFEIPYRVLALSDEVIE